MTTRHLPSPGPFALDSLLFPGLLLRRVTFKLEEKLLNIVPFSFFLPFFCFSRDVRILIRLWENGLDSNRIVAGCFRFFFFFFALRESFLIQLLSGCPALDLPFLPLFFDSSYF